MTNNQLNRERLEKIKSWRETYGAGSNVMLPAEEAEELARIALAAMDSEPVELPLDYLQGHKDGLEWAAQLAEANHPETGDWLYDDPIELAKAIRKGPDMPPVQPAPVVSAELLHTAASAIEDLLTTKDRTGACVWFDLPFRLRSAANAQPVPVVPYDFDFDRFNDVVWLECVASNPHMHSPTTSAIARVALELNKRSATMEAEPDRNPVLAYADSYRDMAKQGVESVPIWSVITDLERNIAPLYRHAQPVPVVPDDVLAALQKVARIRLDMNDFDGDRRGIADCLCDAEEALIEVVNRRAAMLAPAPHDTPALNSVQSVVTVPGTWIPVSERMPEDEQEVLTINRMGHRFVSFFDKHSGLYFDRLDAPAACCIEHVLVTHWMPLPAAPQEVK
ncbi:DUF551 domain-containing protein [Klebsiella pneumoniae]|uniref:DUF551 domain-containing protein n=1 Tax=Klebsiella pneumoniae TaxID=573 RepID=UPI0035B94CB4